MQKRRGNARNSNMQETAPHSDDLARGAVIEALPSANFNVQLESGKIVFTYLSGRMRMNRIKVLVGDNVAVKLDDYGERGRIVKRL